MINYANSFTRNISKAAAGAGGILPMGFTDNAVLIGLQNTPFGDVTMNYEQISTDRAEDRKSKLNEGLNVNGSDLYRRTMERAADDDDSGKLMHKVWDDTPWMVDTYTGSISNSGRYREIMDWCRDKFGSEAWPIHEKPGDWHSGGATIYGYTWMGFATEKMLKSFCEQWVDI